MNPPVSSRQFGLFRVTFGLYLLACFSQMLCGDVSLVGFPDNPNLADGAVWGSLLLSLLFTLGIQRRVVSLALGGLWFALQHHADSTALSVVGLLLLLMALLPQGERFSLSKQNEEWVLPTAAYGTVLIALMAGYTSHSLHQMECLCGMENTVLFDYLPFSSLDDGRLPPSIAPAVVWSILGIQLLAFPLVLLRASRRWIWLALFLLQSVTLLGLGAPQGTGALLLLHFFTFNRDWLPPISKPTGASIVFFDGVCGLCNRAVDVILEEDIYHRYSFAPVQGETAATIDDETVRSGQSMAIQEGGTLYTKSDAVLRIAAGVGGIWRVFSWARILPRPLRDGVYFLVQKSRYQVFGKRETCRLPTPEERRRFLA